jgi:hypothetical protein
MKYSKPEVVKVATALSAIQNTGLVKGMGGRFDGIPHTTEYNTPAAYEADE